MNRNGKKHVNECIAPIELNKQNLMNIQQHHLYKTLLKLYLHLKVILVPECIILS